MMSCLITRSVARAGQSSLAVRSCASWANQANRASAKKPRVDAEALRPPAGAACGDPRTLISWNCNGLVPQLKKGSWSEIRAFVEREQPDLLCLQEVRIPAAGPRGCKRGDGQRRQRDRPKEDSAQDKADWQVVEETLLATFGSSYTFYWSLADWKYSGTALLLKKPLKPSRVTYTLPALAKGGHAAHRDPADASWHPEGRIIMAAFESFDVLTTYAPNNGNNPAAFARRAAWDAAVLAELSARARPLIWIGDLNATLEEVDVTHPEWFSKQCYQGEPADMCGQTGFTLGERRRFAEILKGARLVDAFRRLHPAKEPPPAGGPHYTWRGHPPVHQPVAKYHGRGMRIDYGLVAEELFPCVQDATIFGHGEGRIGFMGSDHSPIRLQLRLPAPAAKHDEKVEKFVADNQLDETAAQAFKEQTIACQAAVMRRFSAGKARNASALVMWLLGAHKRGEL